MGQITFTENPDLTLGQYGDYPNDVPKYKSNSGRTANAADLTVARMFLSVSSTAVSNSMPEILKDFFNNKSGAYVGFILNQVTETRSEKSEIVPLAGDSFASYFFGENPSIYTFDGYFLNTKYARWRDIFDLLYKHIFRGSKVAGHRKLVRIAYDDRIVSGVLISTNQVLAAASEAYSQYQFQVLVYDNAILLDSSDITNTDHLKGQTGVFTTNAITLLPLEADKNYTRTASIVRPPNPLKPKAGTKPVCDIRTFNPEATGANNSASGSVARSAGVVNTGCDVNKALEQATRRETDLTNQINKAKPGSDEARKLEKQRSDIAGEIATFRVQNNLNDANRPTSTSVASTPKATESKQ